MGPRELHERRAEIREALRQVQQVVGLAMLQEPIPPGDHDGIQKYFESRDEQINSSDD